MLSGPRFTIMLMISYRASAAAMVVCSALVSYAGWRENRCVSIWSSLACSVEVLTATSTTSAPTKFSPSRPLRIVRSSRVDHPPVSGVPVAGATTHSQYSYTTSTLLSDLTNSQAGSRVSISKLRYTGSVVPTRSRIFLMIPSMPIVSISRASTISNPQYPSFS